MYMGMLMEEEGVCQPGGGRQHMGIAGWPMLGEVWGRRYPPACHLELLFSIMAFRQPGRPNVQL